MPSKLSLFLRLFQTVRNWHVFFLNHYGWMRGDVTYELRNGMQLHSRRYAVDSIVFKAVWLEHAYDPKEYGIPFSWSKVRHVVDCGAHIGTFTLYAAAKSPRAKIVSLEPDATNLRILQKNTETNGLEKRVTLLSVGLGNGQPVTLYTFPQDRGGNSIYRSKEGGIPMTMRTSSLLEIFKAHDIDICDYLKLDCEGAEYDALYSLNENELKKIRCIGMECHDYSDDPTHTIDRLEQFLIHNGFRTHRVTATRMFAVHLHLRH